MAGIHYDGRWKVRTVRLIIQSILIGSSRTDSDITVRRKTAFLLNAILIPSSPIRPRPSPTTTTLPPPSTTAAPSSTNTSVVLHPTVHADNTSSTPPNIQTEVHPNSHASMIADPSSASTSELTIDALENHGLLQALIDSLTSPVPHGPDGEAEGDPEFEDKVIG